MANDLSKSWWADHVSRKQLFNEERVKDLPKAELMKITYILELNTVTSTSHRIRYIDAILDAQDYDNPFIYLCSDGTYQFNPNVDFWSYIKRAKKYR
jgi:hypothetical protein